MRVSLDPAGKFMDLSPSFACLWDYILSIALQYLAYPSINLLITYSINPPINTRFYGLPGLW